MRIVHRIVATAGVAVALTLATTGIAAAQEAEPPKSPLVEFIESWPPAPQGCDRVWDPIETVVEDYVPEPAKAAFDAFDDWCEGQEDV
ncbi:hypothetical protein [Nocardia rhizosphaerihabitans]|uniref:Uncharacterized protein n=1 Tax=Nocardia rhizosphaerihabitans TaxID=1691570 RepID=A0ABQ2KVK5_9NOCA|nr:hypothetical protein [Nocardia rhizosphaerihabitans]GGN92931.1 hypothetical protein GCM10011610_54380 [Nocardia rhizosphaerihabitans]